MEDYEKFVQRRLSHLRKSEEEHSKPLPASSLIRFYGQPILPPLLSGEQREKMQQHRDAAQTADVQRKLKEDSRMAYVQTILHSVQLRKTPTLEELLQETENNTKSSYSHDNSGGSVSQSNLFIRPTDDLSLFPPTGRKEQNGVPLPPLTSTTYSAFFTSTVTPQQSYQERCLIDQHYKQHGSQPSSLNGVSHRSVSSGYLTFENTTSVSERISAERESHGFGSSDGAYKNNMGGFFLHSTSETIAKMPDIISHPPIDGEELERSGLEASICNNIIGVKDICCPLLQEESVICDHLPVETSDSRDLDSTEVEVNLPCNTVPDTEEDQRLGRIEGPVSSLENSDISDNLESSQTSSPPRIPTAELHIPHDSREFEPADNHVDESKPSEEPYRLSLQALLKKSQEYRRRQRMLRNQAKTTKIQERTQEQTRARAEEQSLSDKENDEFPYKGIVTADGKKTKERRDTSQNKSLENERVIESEFFGEKANFKSQSPHLTGHGNTKEITSVEEETVLKNNKLNISQEILTEPKQMNTFPQQQQPTSIETLLIQEAFYLTNCPKAFYSGVGKYHTIPAPNFCRSPVNCKSKGSIQDGDDGEAVNVAKISKRNVLVDTGLSEDHNVDEVNPGHKNSNSGVPFTGNLMVEGDVTSISARSSQHIDQLESNLSSLKVMISDLESTLTGNLKNHSQTESNTHSEVTFKGIQHSRQSDCDYWEDKLSNVDDSNEAEQDQKYREWQRRQLLDNFKNMQEDTETELNNSDTDNVSLITEVKETEAVNASELRLIKTLATERGKEKGTCKEGLAKSHGQRGGCRMPTAKCILSVSQQQRIPNVLRNVPSATMVSPNVSVPLGTSNHPVESRNETAVDGHDSTYSTSINQSYDVEAPSGLWLLEGSGSDMGSKGHLVQEKHLTPESGGESQGGVSKVKRRLLMHVAKETRSADVSRGATSVLRPNASTPRVAEPLAAVRWYEGHGGQDKQEQLKQTHAAQVRALQDEHRRQQEELLQPSSPLLEHCRPLLLAAVKGFLARRLLKTERVAQLVRTIRDTHQFLQALQRQSPGRGEFHSRQDLLLQERVTLQLRAARYEVHDIFFSLSAGERMQLINWDRELARERELRRQNGHTGNPRGKSSLSTATQKSLERKRGMIIQKKVAERHTGVVKKNGHNTGLSAEQPKETKRGQLRAKPQRVPKDTYSSRPR
ncbi:uncharacterized protein si:ch73-100l22.3 isoform X2 [Etheostoma cragini]|uniref:uncharacterized protein si:ch73-100l22.3 isoform X2 n=1 Tax=Etheostoma cragini TaxID=417921 RepID=UPI00155E21D0|nr:uncharacterized protein si:ch73-100l22.3 isoform X2 [Etheostoma cragini]